MRAILVDPRTRTIAEVVYAGVYTDIYKHIEADCFDAVTVKEDKDGSRETLWVDDEGLYRTDQKFFRWRGYAQPLAGKALLLGTDETGESVATKMTLAEVESMVRWDDVGLQYEGSVTTSGKQDHPLLGPGISVIRNIPVFSKKEKNDSPDTD